MGQNLAELYFSGKYDFPKFGQKVPKSVFFQIYFKIEQLVFAQILATCRPNETTSDGTSTTTERFSFPRDYTK